MIAGTPFIIEHVDAALARLRPRVELARMTVEELCWVRWRCLDGEAVCLSCDDGIAIVRLEPHQNGTMTLKVLFAASAGPVQAFRGHEKDLLAIARDMSADFLAFRTNRRGWARLVGPEWTREGDLFRRSV